MKWPYDYDLYRDSAIAQVILDGRFPGDPFYSAELNWYNPLSPAVAAGASFVFNRPPTEIYARWGALIALVIPTAIFSLAVTYFGRWAGLAGLFSFLFLTPKDLPPWSAPSYSPWLFANLLSLVPFALTLMAVKRARAGHEWGWWVATGALLGVTFLAHTAAAIAAGCVTLVLAWDGTLRAQVGWRWLVILSVAFLLSLPLSVSILGHYGLQVKHPLEFIWEETSPQQIGSSLRGAVNSGNAIALVGAVLLLRDRTKADVRNAMLVWFAISFLMLGREYVRLAWPSPLLPAIVPSFHWLFHLRLVRSLLLGYGLFRGAKAVSAKILLGRCPAPVVLAVILALLLSANFRAFTQRYDFTVARRISQAYESTPGFGETVDWLRRATPPDAVILCEPLNALILLGAAGRRTVVVENQFSNPYVPYEDRVHASDEMIAALAAQDKEGFLLAAAPYHVSYILLAGQDTQFASGYRGDGFPSVIFEAGQFAVLQVKPEIKGAR